MAQLRILVLSAVFSFVSFASLAATGVFRDRLIPGPPGGLTDLVLFAAQSELYFTEFDANRIGRLSRDGQFRKFAVPTPDSGPRGIASSSGAIWFTEYKAGKIGKLTPDGTFTEYVIPSAGSAPWGIALLGTTPWFTESATNKIGRVNGDGSITEFAIPTKDAMPRGIAGYPDQVCFAEFGADQIGCLEKGQFVERGLSPGSGPQDIAPYTIWSDLWFTERNGNRIGVLRLEGVNSLAQARIEEFPIPTSTSGLSGIATDYYEGSAWFTEGSAGQIGFISRDGRITEYPLADRSSRPTSIVLSFLGAQFLEAATNRAVEIQPDAVLVAGAGSSQRRSAPGDGLRGLVSEAADRLRGALLHVSLGASACERIRAAPSRQLKALRTFYFLREGPGGRRSPGGARANLQPRRPEPIRGSSDDAALDADESESGDAVFSGSRAKRACADEPLDLGVERRQPCP